LRFSDFFRIEVLEGPAFRARKTRDVLSRHPGLKAGDSRVGRLTRHMGVSAVARRQRTSLPGKGRWTVGSENELR
jgi:hypothetical protein